MGIIAQMKIKILLLITFLCLIALTFTKTHKKKMRQADPKQEKLYEGYQQPEIRGSGNTKRAQHVGGMMLPLPPGAKDRSPLWKDFTKPGFERPFMHGVVGHSWSVPGAEVTDGFDLIGSPMPKMDVKTKIIATNLPGKTYTGTSFDNPKRKDVVQTDLPTQFTRTVEEAHDPKGTPKKAVKTVHGTVYHNTGSVGPKVVFGGNHSFMQKKITKKSKKSALSKSKSSKKQKLDVHNEARSLRVDGLHHAKQAYGRAGTMLGAITSGSRIILDAKTTNKQEHPHPELRQYENNKYLHDRVAGMRKTPHGVKAAHTVRRMG